MMVRRLLLVAVLGGLACGRDQLTRLKGGADGDGGTRPDGFVVFPDASFKPDSGLIPDTGALECEHRRECRSKYGPAPACPDGTVVPWQCENGVCEIECPPSECVNDCDCNRSLACIGGRCLMSNQINFCCTNPDCPPGDSCIEPDGLMGECPEDRPDGGPRDIGMRPDSGRRDGGVFDGSEPDTGEPDSGVETPVGDPCAAQMLCGPIGFCLEESQGFPDGYCSQDCGPNGSACPSGSDCRGFGGGNAICLDTCSANAECRTDYLCVQVGLDPQRVCWPTSGGSTNPNGNEVGAECSDDQDCDSGLECLNFMGWPDGYCTKQFCDPMTNPCPADSECYNFPGAFSLCLDTCPNGGTVSDCRNGYYCLGATGQPGTCIPN